MNFPPLLFLFASIVALFFFGLILKAGLKKKFCILCASVFTTWAGFLVLYAQGLFHEPILLALLMGGSAVGILYLLERRLPERFHLFRLPFFLTLVWLASLPFTSKAEAWPPLLALVVLWAIFLLFHAGRHHPRFQQWVERLIACCKNW